MRHIKIHILGLVLAVFFHSALVLGQDRDIEIADEYFAGGEYDKAKNMYERLSKNNDNVLFIYNNYITTLLHFKQKEEAEKFIRKAIKLSDGNILYKLDHYILALDLYGEEKTEKEFHTIVNDVKNNEVLCEKTADYFLKHDLIEKAKLLYYSSRKSLKTPYLYTFSLTTIYYRQGNVELGIEELLSYLKQNSSELDNVKNNFQNNFKEDKDFELLETILYNKIQSEPDAIAYNELLLWLNLQKRNFNKAFMQAKAIDKRLKMQGEKMMEVGKIAMDNKDYIAATRFYEYVVKEYSESVHYPMARRELVRAKEETIKNTFPIVDEQITSLIRDYLVLIKELGNNNATLEARRSVALLYAFYLNKIDTSIVILNEAIEYARNDLRSKCKAKIDLGDMYLLKGEPWEATLLYSQVEKDMKEDPLGHDAKLRNAKLSYYKGEFELAQAHLDVLKLATSREISNDAIDLSILIQTNSGLDSTTDAMEYYASIDLLLFQNKLQEALTQTDLMLTKFPSHSLTDELYWLKSKILKKMGDYTGSVSELEKILSTYPDDILGDNALFSIGSIYEEHLKDSGKAMEYYQKFLIKYPSSIFSAEARKRFRLLRGDKL